MAIFDPYPITIDILSRKEPPLVYFHEDDFNTAKLVLHLKRGKTAIALTQSKVRIVLKKEDETIGYLDCDVTDPANGIVEVILSSNSLSVSGVVVCELYISMADKTFVTPRFKYLVDEALFPSGMIESSNEYQSLLNIMKDVEEAQGSFNEAVANLNNKTKEVVTDANKKVSETLSTLNTNGQTEIDKITQTASETKNEADAIINKAQQDTTAAVTKIEKDGAEVIAGFYQSADVEMRKIRTTAEAAKVKSEENTTQIGILSGNVGNKADKTYVDTELSKKATQSDVTVKADKSQVDSLSLKVDGKAAKSQVDNLETRMSDVIQSADLSPNKDQELVDARRGETTLGTKIGKIDTKVMNLDKDIYGETVKVTYNSAIRNMSSPASYFQFTNKRLTLGEKYAFEIIPNTTFTQTSIQIGTNNSSGSMVDTLATNINLVKGETYWVENYVASVSSLGYIRIYQNAMKIDTINIYTYDKQGGKVPIIESRIQSVEEQVESQTKKDEYNFHLANKINCNITELRTIQNVIDNNVSSLTQIQLTDGIEKK